MGHVRVPIKLANPARRDDAIAVESALVDPGATYTTVPGELAERLGLDVVGQRQARSAAGPVTIDESYAFFEYDGRRTVTPVWISDDYPGVLIGVITLEALGLAVDPGSGQLINSELLLL
jgi:predicted aspartyl protease